MGGTAFDPAQAATAAGKNINAGDAYYTILTVGNKTAESTILFPCFLPLHQLVSSFHFSSDAIVQGGVHSLSFFFPIYAMMALFYKRKEKKQ